MAAPTPERGGYILDMFAAGGIGNYTKSLQRCPPEIDAARMKALGHLGVNFSAEYYGDSMTWNEFASAGLEWGVSTAVLYPAPLPGWTYYYDAVGRRFTVTDAAGAQTNKRVNTVADLEISMDVMASHQFKIYFSAKFINDAFLIAQIKRRNQDFQPGDKDDTAPYPDILLAYVDQFFTETLHFTCNRLKLAPQEQPEPENIVAPVIPSEPEYAEILRSNVPARSATGDYTAMALYRPGVKYAQPGKKRNAIVEIVMADFLMIAYFASIHNMTKPVIEPWMIIGMWKWLGSGEPLEVIEKIFDLSPRWGD